MERRRDGETTDHRGNLPPVVGRRSSVVRNYGVVTVATFEGSDASAPRTAVTRYRYCVRPVRPVSRYCTTFAATLRSTTNAPVPVFRSMRKLVLSALRSVQRSSTEVAD